MTLSRLLKISKSQSHFTSEEMNNLDIDKSILKALKSHQILISEYTEKWFCKSCTNYHYYEEFEEKLYKVCPKDRYAQLGKEITDEDRQIWKIDFNKFKNLICNRNGKLAHIDEDLDNNSLLVGENKKKLQKYQGVIFLNNWRK